jgi:cytochrome P450/predicted MFS family arabinose efflux permease
MIGSIGMALPNAIPAYLAALGVVRQLSEGQTGLVGLADIGGITIGSFGCAALPTLVKRVNWRRTIQIGLLLALVANTLSIFATSLPELLMLRPIAGLGCGIAMAVVYAVMAEGDAARNLGVFTVAQLGLGWLAVLAIGAVTSSFGARGLFGLTTASILLALAVTGLVPRATARRSLALTSGTPSASRVSSLGWVGIGSVALFYCGVVAVYSYIVYMGTAWGVSQAEAESSAAYVLFAGMFGGGAAAIMGSRFGFEKPMIIGFVGLLAATALFFLSTPVHGFIPIAMLFGFCFSYVLNYQFEAVVTVDPTSSTAMFVNVAALVGFSAGPAIGGALATADFRLVNGTALLLMALSMTVVLWTVARSRAKDKRASIPVAVANTLVNPRAYAEHDRIDAIFADLRANNPFGLAHPDKYDPFWVASRYADIQEIERNTEVFSNAAGSSILFDRASVAYSIDVFGEPNVTRSLVDVDGREHKELRMVAFPRFAPKSIKDIEGKIRATARQSIMEMRAHGGRCDFAQDVAWIYPLRVIMETLGIPREDEGFMLHTAHMLHAANDPDMNLSGTDASSAEAMRMIDEGMKDLHDYFECATQRLRAAPDDTLTSLIANAKVNGDYMTPRQLHGYYTIAATAGHDTTAFTIGTSMWVLAQRPDLLARLKANAHDIPIFVEEAIRWATPVKSFMRTALADTTVAGQHLRKGDWIMLAYQSANRDEAVFTDPFTFDIDRPRITSLSFGTGPHVCLGQHLARMEMRILWEELLPLLADVQLDGKPRRTISNFVCGPKDVPVTYRWEEALDDTNGAFAPLYT